MSDKIPYEVAMHQILSPLANQETKEAFDPESIPMLLWCPGCHARHIDEGEFATRLHHSHACQNCGLVWRPAIVFTRGVAFLPGFKRP